MSSSSQYATNASISSAGSRGAINPSRLRRHVYAADDDDIPVPCRPLALDAEQFRSEVEDEVVPLIVQRTRDPYPEQYRSTDDGSFSEQALLIGRQFAQHVDGSASLGRAVS